MKMFYGNTPVNSMKIKHYEISTNDCTAIPSDLQSGVTCVSKGKKITGTGKSFEFAQYGVTSTNVQQFVPTLINVVEISGIDYPTKSSILLSKIKDVDFTTEQVIGIIVVDNVEYPITVKIDGHILTFYCEKTATLNFFYGKDNYIW